jgi:FkbM family methyltransferase
MKSYVELKAEMDAIQQQMVEAKKNERIQTTKNEQVKFNEERYEISFKKIILDSKHYFLPSYALHRPAIKKMLNGHLYESKTHMLVETLCAKKHGSIIHAGTFFGDMLPNFSKFVNGSVYAFELVMENFILAKLTVEVNDLSNVILINAALSYSISNLRINTTDKNNLHAGGSSTISEHGKICTSLKIDNLEASDIVLIQLDVEGHELIALSGATETIKRCRPVIAIEDNNKNCDSFLLQQNYKLVRKIPELCIWTPNEDAAAVDLVNSF